MISTVPIQVLGRVIVMFAMVLAAGVKMLSDVLWSRRNTTVFATAISLGFGLQFDPDALQHLPATLKVLATSGILPTALIAITLNLTLPEETADDATGPAPPRAQDGNVRSDGTSREPGSLVSFGRLVPRDIFSM